MVPQNPTTASIDFASPEPASTISSLSRTATNRGAAKNCASTSPAHLEARYTGIIGRGSLPTFALRQASRLLVSRNFVSAARTKNYGDPEKAEGFV
jgi:hypothetical protein